MKYLNLIVSMDILKHFDNYVGDLLTFKLKDSDREEFLSKLPEAYKLAYISESDLSIRIKTFTSTAQKEFFELIPDSPTIMSGDFGEILAFLLFKERHQKLNLNGPLKWRWKQEKNVAAPYTDVILYSAVDGGKASVDDLLISIESKMKAVPSGNYHPIQNAIDGAEKDYLTRITSSLSWLRRKYKEEATKVDASIEEILSTLDNIERYFNPLTQGPFTKKIKAVAFIDEELVSEELAKLYVVPTIPNIDLTIFVVSIADLKGAYQSVLKEVCA